jgi:hypothetical protein
MADAFDFTDLFHEIEAGIADVMSSGHARTVLSEVMALTAQSNVYGAYSPTMYHRRHTMDNPESYRVDASGLTITVENTRTEPYVFDIVESGTGYTWDKSEIYRMQPFPRPYTQQAIDQFTDEWLLPEIERQVFQR